MLFAALRRTWAALRGRSKWESDLDAEIEAHLEFRIADLLRTGLDRAEAERTARLEFGARERYKDEARAAFGLRWPDDVRQDAMRALRRSPGFTVTAIVSLVLGGLALMVAVTGIYGLTSYSVARRVREIGIRTAIGARPVDVLGTVLGRLALLVVGGSMAGIALGFASRAILRNVVYQATSRDPLTLALVGALMLAVALASAWGPIRRAASVDPLHTLRQE